MITHYIELAFQQMKKYRLQSVVSIISLGIGFACFALAMLWIRYERTFDTQHPEAERLYVVYQKKGLNVREPLGEHLATILPEVEMSTKLFQSDEHILIEGVKHEIKDMECDSTLMELMGIEVIEGDRNFWMQKGQYAVTQEFATRVWGAESPIGKRFTTVWSDREKTIAAVVRGYGNHSNVPFEMLYGKEGDDNWYSSRGYVLARLRPNVDGEAFMQKMDTFVVKVPDTVHDWGIGGAFDYSGLGAVPITEFRQVLSDSGETASLSAATGLVQFRHIRLIALAGILLILSGLLNYLTLFLNRIFIRQREVVLRTVFGATTRNIMVMLFTEYALLLVIALGCGLFFMEALLPWFRGLTGIATARPAIYAETLIYSAVVMVAGFLLSAPVIGYFRRRSVQHSLQGRGAQHTYQNFRKVSVVVQMIISISFIFCTAVMMMQLEKLRHTNPGFERQNMAVLHLYNDNDRQAMAQHLNEMPEIKEWHEGYSLFPRSGMIGFGLGVGGTSMEKRITSTMVLGAKEFQQFYGLRLKEGRWIEEGDKDGAVVTESVVKELDVENPIGIRLEQSKERGYTIVGVVEDIYIEDIVMMNIPTEPLLFDLHYGGKSAVEAAAEGASPFDVEYVPADETTPQFKDIFIRDIVCSGAARAMYFNGIPEKNIENIVVENCEIVSEKGADLRYSDGVVLRNVRISQSEGAGYSVANCRNVTMEDCSDASGEETPDVFRYNSQNLTIK